MRRLFAVGILLTGYVLFRGLALSLLDGWRGSGRHKGRGDPAWDVLALDGILILICVVLWVGVPTGWAVGAAGAWTVLVRGRHQREEQRARYRQRQALIDLLMQVIGRVGMGGRMDYVLENVEGNPVSERLKRLPGDFEHRLIQLAGEMDNPQFNRLLGLRRQMERFDSDRLVDELMQLVEALMASDHEERRRQAHRTDELLVFPMALGLMNMIMMLVVPYLMEWRL